MTKARARGYYASKMLTNAETRIINKLERTVNYLSRSEWLNRTFGCEEDNIAAEYQPKIKTTGVRRYCR